MSPDEMPMEEIFAAYSADILSRANIEGTRISNFFNRAIQWYWLLLGPNGDESEIGIDFDYDESTDLLNMSYILPPYYYDNQERRDLTITFEEIAPNLPEHFRTEIFVEIFDESLGELAEIDPSLQKLPDTISICATLFSHGQLFFPLELVVQVDIDDSNAYYFIRYDKSGNLYKIEAMDPDLCDLLQIDMLGDQAEILILDDPRDIAPAIQYINSQFEDDPQHSVNPILDPKRPLHLWDTLTAFAQDRSYRLAPNGIKIPALIYK